MALLRATALRPTQAPVASTSTTPATVRGPPPRAQPAATDLPQLRELRRQWKWAAFSQFFYTFTTLIALDDVTLVDIEEDLVNSTMVVLPRLMQRLLITLSYDRKLSNDNWQMALRRQYLRRDPDANPIGEELVVSRHSRATTVDTEVKQEQQDESLKTHTDINEAEHNAEEMSSSPAPDVRKQEHHSDSIEKSCSKDQMLRPVQHDSKDESNKEGSRMKDWADLSMLEKLESIHTVMEWHFQSPLRLRSIMRSDDESACWRMEPIGYDSKRNAYWLIGPDRLWIQRLPPKPSRKSAKRKATSINVSRKAKAPRLIQNDDAESAILSTPRKGSTSKKAQAIERIARNNRVNIALRTPSRTSRGSQKAAEVEQIETVSPRARAAKTRANVKLDLQARHLAAVKAEMLSLSRRTSPKKDVSPAQRVVGTRVSRRLRGAENDEDHEWQQIPPEWLSGTDDSDVKETKLPSRSSVKIRIPPRRQVRNGAASSSCPTRKAAKKTYVSSEEESELTELSDLSSSDHEDSGVAEQKSGNDEGSHTIKKLKARVNPQPRSESEVELEPQQQQHPEPEPEEPWPPGNFVEWETVCVSLEEWAGIAQKFEKATHYLEKALYKRLVNEIVPFVIEMLGELETQRAKEEALMNRKRSSRLAIRESEKEMARLAAFKQAEEDEKMARVRRLEARAKREEEERLIREQAREQRRKEREERELTRVRRLDEALLQRSSRSAEVEVDVVGNDVAPTTLDQALPEATSESVPERPGPKQSRAKNARKKAARWEEWMLDCEVCGSKGVNKDEDAPLMSCGKCNKWQHILCHDEVDKRAGRPLRNWDLVDFFCKQCIESRVKAKSSQKNANVQKKAARTTKTAQGGPAASSLKPLPQDTDHAEVPRPVTGADRSHPLPYVPSYADGLVPQTVANSFVPAASKRTIPQESQASVTFAHYQPLERGFSQQPMALHRQQPQPYGPSHPSIAHPATAHPVPIKPSPWATQSARNFAYPTLNGHGTHGAYPSPSSSAAYHPHSTPFPSQSYAPQPFITMPNGSLPERSSAPAIPISLYPHVYSQPQGPPPQ